MRVRRSLPLTLAAALCAIGGAEAGAFAVSIAPSDRALTYISGSGDKSPYGAKLVTELLSEARRTVPPSGLGAPTTVLVRFAVNRRGEVVSVVTLPKSRPKVIHDYAEMIVRNASRRFPAPPADTPGDPLLFSLSLRLQ